MQSVQQMAVDVVGREGGYVNDPDDPGGATNWGVTIHTMRNLGVDVDADGDVDVNDVKALTRDQAVDIYMREYFHRPRISELPVCLHETVFDMYVNAGSNAIRILQRLLRSMGYEVGAVDGVLGPKTIGTAMHASSRDPELLRDAYGIARRNYYYRLADRRVKSRKYARRRDGGKGGWIRRAEEFIRPQFHMSDAEHRARVRNW